MVKAVESVSSVHLFTDVLVDPGCRILFHSNRLNWSMKIKDDCKQEIESFYFVGRVIEDV